MDGERRGWWPAVVGAIAVSSVLVAARYRGPVNPLPNAITDHPAALTAERSQHALQRQPTILQADTAVSPFGATITISPLPAIGAASAAAADSWPGRREDGSPAAVYHSTDLDYLPIPASHDQQRP